MADDFILHVSACLTPRERINNASILFRGGEILAVGGFSALRVLDDIPCLDLPDCFAVPGLVDSHLHGSGGVETMDLDKGADMTPMSRILARHGVTSFVPTVLSAERDRMLRVIENVTTWCDREQDGAVPVGIHLEGPYLNPEKRGTQERKSVRPVDLGEAREFLETGRDKIKTLTFAPEVDKAEELIEMLREHGVVPSMGHSQANGEATLRAIDAGATRCTHLFNGMPSLDQRRIALTTIGLTDDRVTVELIVDGTHVHPAMIALACRSKPARQVVCISDANQGAGLREGRYHLGNDDIITRNGESRRVSDGRLAGSCLTLDQGLHNLMEFSCYNQNEALACHTANAARSLGLTDRGVIQPGKRGDVVVLDKDWNVKLTIIAGRVVYDGRDGKG